MAVSEETSLLIDGAKDGDEEAVASLVDAYKDRLFRICLYFTKGEEEAEDLMQDVFLSIFRSLRSLKTNSYFETWMYKIVMNTHYQNIRRKNKRPVFFNEDVLLHQKSEAQTPDESMESDIQRDQAYRTWAKLFIVTINKIAPKSKIIYFFFILQLLCVQNLKFSKHCYHNNYSTLITTSLVKLNKSSKHII